MPPEPSCDRQFLLIVSRDHPESYRRLRDAFVADATLTVIVDRRYGRAALRLPERRRRDISAQLWTVGWALVDLGASAAGATAPVVEPPAAVAGGPAGLRRRARILLVDDDPFVRGMMLEVLRSAGYEPTTAGDPREAVALLATRPFDLVITDLVLPHFDGLYVLEKAREHHPDVPVVMVSAFGNERLVREARQKGARDFIAKPFGIEMFLATVEGLVGESSG